MRQIEITQVTKNYRLGKTTIQALKGVNFTVEEGEFLSVVGASGSGKTTLLNIIGCIDAASEGSVKIDGIEIKRLNDNELTDLRLRKIGFIFQTFNLIPVLNVFENIEFPLLLMNHLPKKAVVSRVNALIEQVGLTDFVRHKPAELSGGQRQRVAIARSLVTNPAIVLADEPTANLDTETGNSILALMKAINMREKSTFIFSTHDPEVLKYADRIVNIRDGRVVNPEPPVALCLDGRGY
ncbi:ABC transporter ATP-binding protein [Desulfoluna sp.]|uniref:ABC transporter ATP-binding protein n=1 Tax=Desulfoluna sp. TaxID=2045199 RepID=UPI00260F4DC4|nr:ABC transporter ATP-binding protein [Desulfoluna sp.]